MEQLIPIINELQDTYAKLRMPFIDLPQIVIIGSQSAGKSSVLENMVKHEFLPRGTGIVTRCPLILHLVHEPDSAKRTRARFLHTGDKDYYDFVHIKDEIIAQTDVLAGPDKNISDQPITLKIYSHDFPSLTLIDLPGLTKVAVESQPKDIDQQIKSTCIKYAQKANSIILAISAANVDLANSDAIRFAEELDPQGKRTLCVITKLDLMDRGTNAYQILTGRILPRELGYVGVVSRSQEDIMKGKPIEESLHDERKFFQKRYPKIAKTNGTEFLTKTLNTLLKKHIQKCLPSLRETIKDKIKAANYKLELLGPEIVDKVRIIPQFLTNFTEAYININEGNFNENLKEIRGGALISEILYKIFPESLMTIDVKDYLTDDVILATIRNTCGADKMSFSRQKPFTCLVRVQIQKLLDPSLRCIEEVYETMKDFVNHASKTLLFSNFPNLRDRILRETGDLIRESYTSTKLLVENLITSERTDVTCSHPNFKLGFALENMNFRIEKTSRDNVVRKASPNQLQDDLLEKGFKVVCQNVEKNLPEFSRMLTFYISKSQEMMPIINLLQNKPITPEDKVKQFNEICERVFVDHSSILEYKDVIVKAVMNENNRIYEALTQHELNKLPELKQSPNKHIECKILRSLVIEYFNMVRKNICYHVPKLIKTFLVIHVREKLMFHLMMIQSDPNIEYLLYEAEAIYKQRKESKALLADLENVKQRIDDIYNESL